MNKELSDYLCRTYPKLYSGRSKPVTESLMAFGFEVGDGWFNIINGLSLMIQAHIDNQIKDRWRKRRYRREYAKMSPEDQTKHSWYNEPIPLKIPQVRVLQVKEKFGTLRFYTSGSDDAIHNYISMAEAMSYVTCETCGKPGKMNTGGSWLSVSCVEHGGSTFI